MKYIIIYCFLLMSYYPNSINQGLKSVSKDTIDAILETKDPYKINVKVNPLANALFEIKIDMELFNGAYYVSPNAKRDFKGKFRMILDQNSNIEMRSHLKEFPLSKEEYDPHPFVNGKVNWVRQNTSYTQQFKRLNQEDFLIRGFIIFTIEPKCTLEKIPIVLSYKNGVLHFEVDNC